MSDEEKIRENRLRRAAERQALRLVKSRRRDTRAADYGRYWLVEPNTNAIESGGQFGLSLDDVEEYLTTDKK